MTCNTCIQFGRLLPILTYDMGVSHLIFHIGNRVDALGDVRALSALDQHGDFPYLKHYLAQQARRSSRQYTPIYGSAVAGPSHGLGEYLRLLYILYTVNDNFLGDIHEPKSDEDQ